MAAGERCILLAGAPDREALCWDETALLSSFDPAFKRFLDDQPIQKPSQLPDPSTSAPKWRSVAWGGPDMNVLWHSYDRSQYATITTDLEFLEHSIAVLDNIDSSQIVDSTAANKIDHEQDNEATFVSFSTNYTDTSLQSNDGPTDPTLSTEHHLDLSVHVKLLGEITDLKRIPKAEHIQRMQPQTITVNLLVGIIATSPPRRVQLRRGKLERDIVEVTVGDETRAGFSLSFWLVLEDGREKSNDDLRRSVTALRSGQVVLLQSVALSCFRGSVYGQSLNRRFARNSTVITVLDERVAGNASKVLESKWKKVREWTFDFVGAARLPPERPRSGRDDEVGREALPPDTQD